MSLSTLHDVPLLRIFYYLPMTDLLLRVNLVCHRWNNLLPTASAQRRSLVLIIGQYRESLAHFNPFGIPFLSELKDGNDNQDFLASLNQTENTNFCELSRVALSGLTTEMIVRLTNLFPNIISLTLIEHKPTNYIPYFQLLWSIWTDNLVTLKIILLCDYDFKLAPAYFWNGLVGRILELSKLKNLTFYCNRNIRCQVNFTLICKLEKLNFYLPDDNIEFGVWESLRWFASPRMRQLGLLCAFPRNEPNLVDHFGNRDTELVTSFTHLSFNRIINFDIRHFQNVTTIKLSDFYSSRPLSANFLPLSQLQPHLVHVILHLDGNTTQNTIHSLANSPKSQVHRLTSVKVLSLHFDTFWLSCDSTVDDDSFGPQLYNILIKFFPNVEYLSFLAYEYGCLGQCSFCPMMIFESNNVVREWSPRVLTCLRRWLRTLKSALIGGHRYEEGQGKLSLLGYFEVNVLCVNLYRKWSLDEL